MTAGDEGLTYRRLRAPSGNGEVLLEPPLCQTESLLAANRQRLTGKSTLTGQSLDELRNLGRRELISAALAYTKAYRDVPNLWQGASHSEVPLFLSGHQPQLFHPGVWIKNFILGGLAKKHGGIAVNLSVDNDVIKSASIRVPGGTFQTPVVGNISFDVNGPELPSEERTILDPALLATFGQRAMEQLTPFVPDPLLRTFCPIVLEQARTRNNLGECLARARHRLEADWGLETLEVPQSTVCEFASFHQFVAELLRDLPRFVRLHNETLAEYRHVHRLRNLAHPIPDLAQQDDWFEAPFWIWDRNNPRRRKLFARAVSRQNNQAVELSDRAGWQQVVSLTSPESLLELSQSGIKLRTRALTTTLFSRLFLSDLFIHGIGGAKYDQITDRLIVRFYGIQPPDFLVATATLKLPIAELKMAKLTVSQIDQTLWRLQHQPDQFFDDWTKASQTLPDAERWLAQKRRWLQTPVTSENSRTYCHAIRDANSALQPFVIEIRNHLLQQRDEAIKSSRRCELLGSREFAFCLHPAETLRELLLNARDLASQ